MFFSKKSMVHRTLLILIFLSVVFLIISILSGEVYRNFHIGSKEVECSNLLSMADVYVSNNKETEFLNLYDSVCNINELNEISSRQFIEELSYCLNKGSKMLGETSFLEQYPNFCMNCISYSLSDEVLIEDVSSFLNTMDIPYELLDVEFQSGQNLNVLITFNSDLVQLETSSRFCYDS